MLPDLASMVATRNWRAQDEQVTAGVSNHHEADRVFHAHPVFVDLCQRAYESLRSGGLARGPTLAVAHVGIELLIDGELSTDTAAVTLFRRSLAEDAALVQWGDDATAKNYRVLVQRLQGSALPTAYRNAEEVAPQLRRILSRRPRLAMGESDVPIVARWLASIQPEVASHARPIVDAVVAGVRLTSSS
ncbi:MAG: hypothetical protein JKY37_16635 [Nannocystaceae bacterium]|nr:hypothetical protein [Nannocystaceae bacterium]